MNRIASTWLGKAQVTEATLEKWGCQPFDVVELSHGKFRNHELTTCIVQLIPCRLYKNDDELSSISVHPVLCDYLEHACGMMLGCGDSEFPCINGVSLEAFHGPGACCSKITTPKSKHCWQINKLKTITSNSVNQSKKTTIQLYILYRDETILTTDLDQLVRGALDSRWIKSGTAMILPADTDSFVVALVKSIDGHHDELQEGIAYQLGPRDTFEIQLTFAEKLAQVRREVVNDNQQSATCPGYETLVDTLVQLLSVSGTPAASGMLLSGCAGVGKTQLLVSVQSKLKDWQFLRISIQDALQELALSSEDALFRKLIPIEPSPLTCLVIDDLDVLSLDEASDELSGLDYERKLILNNILRTIDQLVALKVRIVGIAQDTVSLPPSLVKSGRLEKNVTMNPPSQLQREAILFDLLIHASYDTQTCEKWSKLLAPATSGCVAADLHRLAADAWTRTLSQRHTESDSTTHWENWKEATLSCLPSQLASLDVTKPTLYFQEDVSTDWLNIHESSWHSFFGYSSIKKRVFRTVVAPWRRKIHSRSSHLTKAIVPPSGVLFHGKSGCGKTFAAHCLGSSLGLPIVKVRPADVLDKWLGGSEQTLRSLFARARAAAPSILFFDEIDSIASNRGIDGESTDVMSRLLSTFLNELDGVSSGVNDFVLVVACTNRLDALDTALLRPGRLEEHIEICLPTEEDTRAILESLFSRIPLDNSVDLNVLVSDLSNLGLSAADLEGIARESVFRCMRGYCGIGDIMVTKDHIDDALHCMKTHNA
jgi:SpoVK/Ycf46/Vps4 family AAA+-type ATPase